MADCLFCKIIKQEIPAKIVYADEKVLAFEDIHPQAPVHILIIPKIHLAKISQVNSETDFGYLTALHRAARQIIKDKNLAEAGFRIVINNGKSAGQAVFHLHFHLLAGRKFGWPPG